MRRDGEHGAERQRMGKAGRNDNGERDRKKQTRVQRKRDNPFLLLYLYHSTPPPQPLAYSTINDQPACPMFDDPYREGELGYLWSDPIELGMAYREPAPTTLAWPNGGLGVVHVGPPRPIAPTLPARPPPMADPGPAPGPTRPAPGAADAPEPAQMPEMLAALGMGDEKALAAQGLGASVVELAGPGAAPQPETATEDDGRRGMNSSSSPPRADEPKIASGLGERRIDDALEEGAVSLTASRSEWPGRPIGWIGPGARGKSGIEPDPDEGRGSEVEEEEGPEPMIPEDSGPPVGSWCEERRE